MSFGMMVPDWLRELYPFKSHTLEIGPHALHYIDEGRGPVVFLLHGNPTWSFFYRGLIKTLSKNFRVIAPDYLGCGLSDKVPGKRFRAIDRVDEIEALYEHLKIHSFSIVMHDWGGAIGTRFLLNHIDEVKSITYLNTTLTEVELLPRMIKWSAKPIIGRFLTQTTKQFLRYLVGPGSAKKLSLKIKQGYFYPYPTMGDRAAIWNFVSDIPFSSDHPTQHELIEMKRSIPLLKETPVQIIWGLKDPCFHPAILRSIHKHFPHAEVHELPHASHLVLEDEPNLSENLVEVFLQRIVLKEGGASSIQKSPSENTLYKSLKQIAQSIPQATAIVDVAKDKTETFGDLFSLIQRYQRGLLKKGIEAGDRVLMLVPPGVEFISLAYAVMGCGALPIFIDPGMGKKNLMRCIQDAAPHGLIGIPKAQLLKLKKRSLFPGLRFSLTVSASGLASLEKADGELEVYKHPYGEGLVAFTSGATGTPKGVVFTNEMLEDQLRIFSNDFGFTKGSLDLPLLPIFSIFSMPLGVGSVFPKMDPAKPLELDPAHIVSLIEKYKVQSSFGSPTLWDKISRYCVDSKKSLSVLSRVLMAGAPVPPVVLERVQSILPNGMAYTPYGATEALPVTRVTGRDLSEIKGHIADTGEMGTPVGHSVKGVEIKIIELRTAEITKSINQTKEVQAGTVGEIIVRGKNVSTYYLHRPDADAKNKIRDGDSIWHRIGDVGYLDEKGNLFYCGRKSHVVYGEDRIYFPDAVENVFNQHPWVKRSALISIKGASKAGVAIEPFPEHMPTNPAVKGDFVTSLHELGQSSEITRGISKFFFHPSFPVDSRHNAKIFRDQLSCWAQQFT